MIDEVKAAKAKERGLQAEAILRNELFQESFKTIELAYIQKWSQSAPHETQARENYYLALQILADVQDHIKQVLQKGKVAKSDLDDLANKFRPRAA